MSEITRLIKAFGYSFKGLKAAFAHEAAFRTELAACAALIPISFFLEVSATERALLIGVLLLTLIVELINSAIEAAIDRIGSEHHELSGRAKDLGSAAVLVSLINAALVWAAILLP